jgi:hypothetical protein
VEREARVALKPALDRWRLVGGGVVEHDVHVEVRRQPAVDQVQEAAELRPAARGWRSPRRWPSASALVGL